MKMRQPVGLPHLRDPYDVAELFRCRSRSFGLLGRNGGDHLDQIDLELEGLVGLDHATLDRSAQSRGRIAPRHIGSVSYGRLPLPVGVQLRIENRVDAKSLRSMAESLRDKLGDAVVVLAVVNDGKAQLAAGVSKSLNARVKAGEVVSYVAQQMGGKGGGKPDLAMAGAPDVAKLDVALAGVETFLQTK